MNINEIENYFEEAKTNHIGFNGECFVCKKNVVVKLDLDFKEKCLKITGGAIYKVEEDMLFLKCDDCFKKDHVLRKYRPCEVYSRVVGYLRPIKNWNKGKRAEFKDRKVFNEKTFIARQC